VRSGISLFEHLCRLEERGGGDAKAALVLRGACDRLVPTLMTAGAAAAMFVPVLIMGTRPGYELLHPAAIALLGGLSTSILLNLFVLPVLYLRFGVSAATEPAEETAGEELVPALNV
jgi:Cu/Ag efflux pump CusA